MALTNLTIIPATTYGTPSGNYDGSSLDFFSDAVKAVDYYQGQGSLETVTIRVRDFQGTVKFWATLDYNPDLANWFEVYTYSAGASSPITDYYHENLLGNFVWLRAEVINFEAGTIESISVSY